MLYNLQELITIDRRSTVHYDLQVKESIKSLILDKTFYYKTELSSPDDLADQLKVANKFTIAAYKDLEFERYIKKNKKGIFAVSYFELTNYFFDRNTAIYDAIISLGMTPSIECVEKKVVKLDEKTIMEMGFKVTKNRKFFYINRLYLGDMKPIIILENYLPLYIFSGIDEKFVGDEPLNAYLDEIYNVKTSISNRVMKAVNLNSELAALLNERKNVASIQSTNHVYDKDGRLIDYGISHTISSYYFQALITKDEMNSYRSKLSPTEKT